MPVLTLIDAVGATQKGKTQVCRVAHVIGTQRLQFRVPLACCLVSGVKLRTVLRDRLAISLIREVQVEF